MVRGVRRMSISVGSAILFPLLLCVSLHAQITGGSIVGTVTDPFDAVIAGASVEAANVGTGVVNKTVTSAAGKYEFPLLPAGRYVLSVEVSGFQRATTAEMELHAGTQPKIDFKMTVGELTQSVEVAAAAPLVNATTTELGVVIESQKIRDLPLNG